MSSTRSATVAIAAAALAAFGAASASNMDHLMIVDSGADRVMLFDAFSGAPVNVDWLSDASAIGWSFTTPKEALAVGGEIWVSDQVIDAIHRFAASDLSFLGSVTQNELGLNFDNLRGMGTDGAKVYLTNFGSPIGPAIITIDIATATATSTQNLTGSPFDAEPVGNELYVSQGTGGHVQRYEIGGGLLGNFASGFSTPQQVARFPDGSILVAGSLGGVGVRGLYHYNADGSLITFLDTHTNIGVEALRGGWILGNGDYILATAAGVWTASPDDGGGFIYTQVHADSDAQFISLLPGAPCPADLDGCGVVNAMDLALLLGNWGNPGLGDLDGSGAVGSADLALMLGQWGPCL